MKLAYIFVYIVCYVAILNMAILHKMAVPCKLPPQTLRGATTREQTEF